MVDLLAWSSSIVRLSSIVLCQCLEHEIDIVRQAWGVISLRCHYEDALRFLLGEFQSLGLLYETFEGDEYF